VPETFKDHLDRVRGTIRRINIHDDFARRRDISMYYWNHASDLNAGALVVWNAYAGKEGAPTPQSLGLGQGFSFMASLGPVFALLAGLSLELSLKATTKIVDRPLKATHRLNELRGNIGISVSADQRVILDILTDHIYWRSRYPVPRKEADWLKSMELFNKAWKRPKKGSLFSAPNEKRVINLENYEALWKKFATAYWQAKNVVWEP
jgi:hypothetical protein